MGICLAILCCGVVLLGCCVLGSLVYTYYKGSDDSTTGSRVKVKPVSRGKKDTTTSRNNNKNKKAKGKSTNINNSKTKIKSGKQRGSNNNNIVKLGKLVDFGNNRNRKIVCVTSIIPPKYSYYVIHPVR